MYAEYFRWWSVIGWVRISGKDFESGWTFDEEMELVDETVARAVKGVVGEIELLFVLA